MPSDIMDRRHMPSFYRPSMPPSLFPEEMRFPSEKQIGFWKTAPMSDHRGLETMPFISGGNAVSSLMEKIFPAGGNAVDFLELPQKFFNDPKGPKHSTPLNFQRRLMGAESIAYCWTTPGQNVPSRSVEGKKVTLNGTNYENGFFLSTPSGISNKQMRLSSNDVFAGQSVNTAQSNFAEDEEFGSLEELEAQTIGDLLPNDDDLLSGAIQDLGYVAESNRTDAEEDLFCSLGGMELESDVSFSGRRATGYARKLKELDNLASKLPCGDQPTRTLFVKNINSNIEDFKLRSLFEQYGDIEALCTSFRNRGFILVSYYDIRAALNAIRMLQTMAIGDQKLDVEFCNSKENPSNDGGVLLVTNLDSCVSEEDILHIFSVYGEIKEISEIPLKQQHKVIEFYDARAAEAAVMALNKCDIVGKRITVEPCGLRNTIFHSMEQYTCMDLKEGKISRCGDESYYKMLPSECFVPSGLRTLGANTSSGLHNGTSLGMNAPSAMLNSSSMEPKFQETPSSMTQKLSCHPGRASMVKIQGNQSGNCEPSHSLEQMNLGFQNLSTFTEFHDGVISGIPFNSPSTISTMVMNVSSTVANGIDNRNIHTVCSGSYRSHPFDHNDTELRVSGDENPPGIWNGSYRLDHPSSMPWQNLPPFLSESEVHGIAREPSPMLNSVLPHQLVGSAPSVNSFCWNRRHSFTGDTTDLNPSSLENMGYSTSSKLQSLRLASHSMFPHAGGTCVDPYIASAHVGVSSPPQRSHMPRGRSAMNPLSNLHDTPHERIRSRRSDSSTNQADSRKQFELDIDRIIRGEDTRTTLMIKNIPNKYTSKMLLATIDEQHKGTYDFIYLPIDFKNKCNVGYAFINMTDPKHIIPFYQAFNGKKWEKFNSEKVAYLAFARIQGKSALIAHFQNSSLMNEDKRCRPIIFRSDGPNAGDQEPFPVGINIRSRRSRTNTGNHQGSPSGSSSGDESLHVTGSPSGSTKDSE